MATAELVESAVLTEASPLMSAGQDTGKGVWRTRIIEADVQGSSGYYPAEVLMRDGPPAFPAGTHVYLDHPTEDDEEARPERSVKDLAGYLVDGARFEETAEDGRGLFARIQFIPELKERIKSLAPVLGLSIRASGEVESLPSGARIVRSIARGLSVDVVTRAGAGGRLVNMTESTTPESPPADNTTQKGTTIVADSQIPSTTGSGTLLSEVASMRDTIADRMEQMSVEIARLNSSLKESQRQNARLAEENKTIRERVESIDERQRSADTALGESKQVGGVVGELIKAGLPTPSLVRIAESYRAGQDLHATIQGEREYLKKVMRDTETTSLGREPSGLGLTESTGSASFSAPTTSFSSDEMTEMDAVLSGKLY